jgi:hypothetical protein
MGTGEEEFTLEVSRIRQVGSLVGWFCCSSRRRYGFYEEQRND